MSDTQESIELPQELKILADACEAKNVQVAISICSNEFKSNTKAYQAVYGNDLSADSARASVSRMLADVNVSKFYEAYHEYTVNKTLVKLIDYKNFLSNIITSGTGDLAPESHQEQVAETKARIEAGKNLTGLNGWDAVKEVKISGLEIVGDILSKK